ncbi:MAG: glycosyltransferase family 2 protein [Anaerolineae bacterium]|nr:glycosyltransferase family 2 protein [Anaerolineae bacterium]
MNECSPVLSIIIVSWNVCELLRRALTSVYDSWGARAGLEVIVVDNASHDGSTEMVRAEFPQVRLIANEHNLGFTGGNNCGIVAATGDFLLLLNSDTEVLAGALSQLVSYMQAHPHVGVVGAQLCYPDGSVQSSRRHFPTLPVLFLESTWFQGFIPRALLRHYYAENNPDDAEQQVDWVMGAALLVRRQVVEQVGKLDEAYFMYSEELDWCRRIKAAGWHIVYLPTAQVIHYEGKSSEQVVTARHIYFQSSKVTYARKYHGLVIAELLRLSLMSQYLWQMGLESAKWLLGHRRDLRAARISAYRDVLRSRLRQRGEWKGGKDL